MTEDKIYEALGRKQAIIEAQDLAYSRLLDLAACLVSGDIPRSRVLVDVTNRTWTLAPKGEKPCMPATINGLPRCIVAPEEEPVLELERNGA